MAFSEKVKNLARLRSQGICEGCGDNPAREFHHRQYKSRGGKDTIENCLHLCGFGNTSGCHGKAHSADHPEGWAVHSWAIPQHEPVALHYGRALLNPDGTVETEAVF